MRAKVLGVVLVLMLAAVTSIGLAAPAPTSGRPIDVQGVFHAGEPGQVVWRAIKPAELERHARARPRLQHVVGAAAQLVPREGLRDRRHPAHAERDGVRAEEVRRQPDRDAAEADRRAARSEPVERPSRSARREAGSSRGWPCSTGRTSSWAPRASPAAARGDRRVARQVRRGLGAEDARRPVGAARGLRASGHPARATYGRTTSRTSRSAQLVTKARATDAGMAGSCSRPRSSRRRAGHGRGRARRRRLPDAGEPDRRQFAFGNPQFVHKEIEVMAGGAMTWNHGVDYRDLLARSGSIERVRWWYAKAGLDLDADLDALDGAPRFAAEPAAVARVEDTGRSTGRPAAPVLSIKTIGDPADPVALDEAYVRTFGAAGTGEMLRTAFIHRSGHSSQSLRERLAAFQTLIDRLDSGPGATRLRPEPQRKGRDDRRRDGADRGPARNVRVHRLRADPDARAWDFTNWARTSPSYVDRWGSTAFGVRQHAEQHGEALAAGPGKAGMLRARRLRQEGRAAVGQEAVRRPGDSTSRRRRCASPPSSTAETSPPKAGGGPGSPLSLRAPTGRSRA